MPQPLRRKVLTLAFRPFYDFIHIEQEPSTNLSIKEFGPLRKLVSEFSVIMMRSPTCLSTVWIDSARNKIVSNSLNNLRTWP
jgi:hypothetical protein